MTADARRDAATAAEHSASGSVEATFAHQTSGAQRGGGTAKHASSAARTSAQTGRTDGHAAESAQRGAGEPRAKATAGGARRGAQRTDVVGRVGGQTRGHRGGAADGARYGSSVVMG